MIPHFSNFPFSLPLVNDSHFTIILFIYLFYPFPTGLVSPPLASHILSSTCFPPPLAHPECACLLAPVERKGEEKGHLTAVGVSYCCFFSLLFSLFSYITRLHRILFDFLISFCQEGCGRSLWVSPPSHLDHLLLLDSAFSGHPGFSVVLFLIFFSPSLYRCVRSFDLI